MKTHSGAKKRFKLTANGKVKARHAFSSHILEKKSPSTSTTSPLRAYSLLDGAAKIDKLAERARPRAAGIGADEITAS